MSSVGAGVATLSLVLAALAARGHVAVGLVVLALVFVPLERALAVHPQPVFRRGWATDAVHFVVNNLLGAIGFALVGLALLGLIDVTAGSALQDATRAQPGWLQLVEAIVVADLAFYLAHRLTHRVPWLWRLHAIHHSSERLDWLAAARQHPIDQVFTRGVTALPLVVLGFDRSTFGAYLAIATIQAIFIHANLRLRFGALRWVVNTPEFHHWHHARELSDVNFGGQLPVIDLLFGTLHLPGRWPAGYGIDADVPVGYMAQLVHPFARARS